MSETFVTRSAQFRRITPRNLVRHAALTGLSVTRRLVGSLTPRTPAVQWLLLHHVFDDEADAFARLMTRLAGEHKFVSYGQAVEAVCAGAIRENLLAVSFDDGLRSGRRAAEVLGEIGISACFFVCGDAVNERTPEAIRQFCADKLDQPPVEFLDWDDIEALRDAGHEIGGHTMGHRDLARLDASQIADQVGRCHEVLTERFGVARHFAWPYGKFTNMSAQAVNSVFESGFETCASAERGCHAPTAPTTSRHLCIRRDQVMATWPIDHVRYFLARNRDAPVTGHDSWPTHLS